MKKLWAQLRAGSGRLSVRDASQFEDKPTAHAQQSIFDLQNIRWDAPCSACQLLTLPFGEGGNPEEPGIESFLVREGVALQPASVFLRSTRDSLRQQAHKPVQRVDVPAYVLPYYTNHFGHFTGEMLGSLITLSKLIPLDSTRKLFAVWPRHLDGVVRRYANAERLVPIDAAQALRHTLEFTDAIALPRIGPWQSLLLAQHAFESLPARESGTPERVFLTSGRNSRIANIDEVMAFLQMKGFYVLNPLQHAFEDTLVMTRDARYLLAENGSILHNVLLGGRRAPYGVFSSPHSLKLAPHEFAGGGVFNMLHFNRIQPIVCEVADPEVGSHHPYSNQIRVGLQYLETTIESASQ